MKSLSESIKELEKNEASIKPHRFEIEGIIVKYADHSVMVAMLDKRTLAGDSVKKHSDSKFETGLAGTHKKMEDAVKAIGAKEGFSDKQVKALIKHLKKHFVGMKVSESTEKIDEAKSKEASMVLKLMDSDYEDMGYQKLVDIVCTATSTLGPARKKLEKELDQYI